MVDSFSESVFDLTGMDEEEELAGVTQICERLGANPEQARTMAAQLLKRASQLAAERGIERHEALDYLLKLTISGREGEVHPQSSPRQS